MMLKALIKKCYKAIMGTFVQNAFWLTATEVITRGAMFALLISIIKNYQVEQIADFNYAYSLALILAGIIDFGIIPHLLRELKPNKEGQQLLTRGIHTRLITIILSLCIIFISLLVDDDQSNIIVIVFVFGFIAIRYLKQTIYTIYRVSNQFYIETIIGFLEFILTGLLSLAVFFGWIKQIETVAISLFFISVLTFLIALLVSIQKRTLTLKIGHSFKNSLSLLNKTKTLAFSGFAGQVFYQVNTPLIAFLSGKVASAQFSTPFNLMYGFSLIPRIVTQVLYPQLAADYRRHVLNLKRVSLFSLILLIGSLALILPIAILPTELINKILNTTQFTGFKSDLLILSLFILIKFQSSLFGTVLDTYKKESYRMRFTVVGILIDLILLIGLTSLGKSNSGTIAITAAESFIFILSLTKVISLKKQLYTK